MLKYEHRKRCNMLTGALVRAYSVYSAEIGVIGYGLNDKNDCARGTQISCKYSVGSISINVGENIYLNVVSFG